MSKRVTFAGAAASFFAGLAISALFMADALIQDKALALRLFPFLHYPITENYTYRGAWGTLVITLLLFAVSAFTAKTEAAEIGENHH